MVPLNAGRVLELGCATGRFGEALKRRRDCHITGIEYAPETAERARHSLDRVIVGDCESLNLEELFQSGEFDCLIAADVLEHLRDPEDLLRRLQPYLTCDASIVVSIPNVRHAGVLQAAVQGYWTYRQEGILDRTHLRFFTRREIGKMFTRLGFEVEEYRRVVDPARAEWDRIGRPSTPAFGALTVNGLSEDEISELFVIQWLARARSGVRPRTAVQAAVPDRSSGAAYVETIGWDMEGLSPGMTVASSEIQALTEERARLVHAHQELSSDHASVRAQNEAALNELAQLEAQHQAHALQHQAVKAQLEADLATLRRQYDTLTASTSWRLTRPLRDVAYGRGAVIAPVRSLVRFYPKARRAARRVVKAVRLTLRRNGSRGAVAEATAASPAPSVNQVRSVVGPDATLLVATSGEEKLLQLHGPRTSHFPQSDTGAFAGHDPPDSTAAIAHLEALRVKGADFLLLPNSTLEWLDRLGPFRQHLSRRYRLVTSLPDAGLLFSLRDAPAPRAVPGVAAFDALALHDPAIGDDFAILDWHTDLDLARHFPQQTIFAPPNRAPVLPYLDHSVDVVVVRDPDQNASDEARRVARAAVITFTNGLAPTDAAVETRVEWLTDGAVSQLPSASVIVTVSPDETAAESRVATIVEFLPGGFRGEILIAANQVSSRAREVLCGTRGEKAPVRVLNASAQEAALLAEGDVLIFVAEGALPLPDAIPVLLRSLRRLPDVGVVGSRVVGCDGRLCEAGGIVSDAGTLQALGAGCSKPDDPAYGFVRQVDWCSRNLLATWRTVFEENDGLNLNYRSGRFQDADYCLRVRQDGRRLYYQPASVVVSLGDYARPNEDAHDVRLFAEHWARAGEARLTP
jgi:2-polyprenyl-3-methyl-5-hydroxy-6-metoxy-1,4-benzoquinol methylase